MEMENQLQDLPEVTPPAIGPGELKKFMRTLQEYKAGKANTDRRIIASESWWKLRNTEEERKETEVGRDGGFTSRSGWLHNVIVSKHADAMESFPSPNILPREQADRAEARRLSHIVPCILEHNQFEKTYSDAIWQKMKTGTGAYKVIWDQSLLNGLGDIRVERVNLLNLYWQPGITDIQHSRFFFQTELVEKEVLLQKYPQLRDKLKSTGIFSSRFLYDDAVSTANAVTVIEVYYHKHQAGSRVLHYCKFVGDHVLFATENETQPLPDPLGQPPVEPDGRPRLPMAETGLYDHGLYPYVLDPLFPIEGSPCGYGFVDLCKNPQTEIDLMKTSFVKNAMAGAIPRYFAQENGNVKAEDFLDLSKPLVPVSGSIDEASYRRIEHTSLDGNYLNLLQQDIQELRETSGNTETSAGNISSGVTAASAIAALQEASGKGSRDATRSTYRAYVQIVNLCIELIRQFYCLPRQFRILGENGNMEFTEYTNAALKLQPQSFLGRAMGMRKPVFDVKVSAQKKNAFSTVSQNELALQLLKMGFFQPQMADQAVMCLEMMDFEGKEVLLQRISRNAVLQRKLQQYMQLSLTMARQLDPALAQTIALDLQQTTPAPGGSSGKTGSGSLPTALKKKEPAHMAKARARAANAVLPGGGKAEV